MKALSEFLAGASRNAWIVSDNQDMDLYVRRAFRIVDGQTYHNVLDLANLKVRHDLIGQGIFTAYLPIIEDIARSHNCSGVFVENILEPRFAEFFRRNNYLIFSSLFNTNAFKKI